MLEKIIRIKNVGRFKDYSAKGNVSFKKLTLVHADNGRGKTTLCAILRSLQTGKSDYILERKTLSSTGDASVQLLIDGENCAFTGNAWPSTGSNAIDSEIAIFDPVFVSENVYSGDFVDHEHRKNMYRIVVGAEGVELAQKIDELSESIRQKNNQIAQKRSDVARYLPSGIDFDVFVAWEPIPNVAESIKEKSDKLAKLRNLQTRAEEIQVRPVLGEIVFPTLPRSVSEVIATGIEGMMENAEIRVREHLTLHGMDGNGEEWLARGLNYLSDDKCPFCGQNVQEADIIGAYRSYFREEYEDLSRKLILLGSEVSRSPTSHTFMSAVQRLSENSALLEFWRQMEDIALPELSAEQMQTVLSSFADEAGALIQSKRENIALKLKVTPQFNEIERRVAMLEQQVRAYNDAVRVANVKLNEIKASVSKPAEINDILKELHGLSARQQRFSPEAEVECNGYRQALQEKAALEADKSATREKLDAYCGSVLAEYEDSINEFLSRFNAGFRVCDTSHRYSGGSPRAIYGIEINQESIALGDPSTAPGKPCFKTALSSGDKSALALAFFIATLKHTPGAEKRIVVFDDPFSSLDRFRRVCTQQLIQSVLESSRQVVILSHDPYFLRDIWHECPSRGADAKTLQMRKSGQNTGITKWDVEDETQNQYMKDYATLLRFSADRHGDLRNVARAIRPFVEGLLRVHFPGQFGEGEWLGEFLEKVRGPAGDNELAHAREDLSELDAINDYSKKYHHSNSTSASEPIDEDELHGFVVRTLRLTGGPR